MKASRLEEVLDECLTAYFDGRRTIEDSLSLYPAIRQELEPLLRTAVEVTEAFRSASPRPRLQERGRQEFLNSASIRRRARELTQEVNFSRRVARAGLGGPWLLLLVAAFSVSFVAVAAAVSAFESSSPREAQPQAVFVSPSAGPDISQLRDAQERLRDEALGGDDVSASTIRELVEQTKDLEEQLEVAALDARSRRELEMAISEQAVLLRLIASSRASEAAATQALEVTKRVAEDLGVDLPAIASPSAVVSPTPAPTAGPTLSPSPGPSTSPTATPPAETPTATAAPELP